jgi:hypothetical protein
MQAPSSRCCGSSSSSSSSTSACRQQLQQQQADHPSPTHHPPQDELQVLPPSCGGSASSSLTATACRHDDDPLIRHQKKQQMMPFAYRLSSFQRDHPNHYSHRHQRRRRRIFLGCLCGRCCAQGCSQVWGGEGQGDGVVELPKKKDMSWTSYYLSFASSLLLLQASPFWISVAP